MMTAYLVSLGHKNIGYVRGPVTNVLEHERFAGYKDAPGKPSAAEVAKALMGQRPEKFTR